MQYEVIDNHTSLAQSDPVLMTGYGCGELTLNADGGMIAGKYDRHLRVGDAIISAPVAAAGSSVRIFSDLSQVALCPGDSGGPLLSGSTAAHQSVHRRLRGVNSTLNSEAMDHGGYRIVSTIAALSSKAFTDLTHQWLACNPAGTICGINGNPGVPPCAD